MHTELSRWFFTEHTLFSSRWVRSRKRRQIVKISLAMWVINEIDWIQSKITKIIDEFVATLTHTHAIGGGNFLTLVELLVAEIKLSTRVWSQRQKFTITNNIHLLSVKIISSLILLYNYSSSIINGLKITHYRLSLPVKQALCPI